MSGIEPIYIEIARNRTDKPWCEAFPRILKKLMTLEQAELILAMPGTTEKLVAQAKMPKEMAVEFLHDMFNGNLLGENGY
jgi:hypothetical protein